MFVQGRGQPDWPDKLLFLNLRPGVRRWLSALVTCVSGIITSTLLVAIPSITVNSKEVGLDSSPGPCSQGIIIAYEFTHLTVSFDFNPIDLGRQPFHVGLSAFTQHG